MKIEPLDEAAPQIEGLTAFLRQISLFKNIPQGELKYLAETLSRLQVEADTIVFRENEPGESIYFVVSGSIDVFMGMDTADEKLLSTLKPGDYTGEMSLMSPGGKRSASCRSRTKSLLLVMTREDFDELLRRQPQVAYAMVKVISDRLRHNDNVAFQDLREKNRQLQAAYDELKAAQAQIIEKEKLEKELQLAAEIQMSILPRSLPVAAGVNFGGHMTPARKVGGDLYDVFQLDKDRTGLLIGDVADKGLPSAIFMARTHALLTAEGLRGGGPVEALRAVNTYLTRLDQSDLFVTVIYGIFDSFSGDFTFARAGHELPFMVEANGKVTQFPMGKSLPLGLYPDIPLDEQTIPIPAGGTLLLFTDGLSDCRNPLGEEFGRERISATLAGLRGVPAAQACAELVKTLSDFRQEAPQDDDITLVVLHRD